MEERIKELEASLKAYRDKLQSLQMETQKVMQSILTLNGGLNELKRLQKDLNTTKETKK